MNKSIKNDIVCLIGIYLVVFILSLMIGRYTISIYDILTLRFLDSQLKINIIFNLRLPRTIMATLAGISLSLSGLIYQETFQNDLVSPDLLGVQQGAGVGASIAIVFGLSNFFIGLSSFVFGIITVLLTVILSNIFKNKNNITLILSGIIVGSFMSSVLTIIKYFVNPETQLSTIVYWLMGSFANVTYGSILFIFPVVLIIFLILCLISHRINLISLGKEETETKGINYYFYVYLIIIMATLLTATTVSCCGTIGWIGLIIPHIVKAIVGCNVNKTLPICAILGAIFTIIADIISRTLVQSEIPISAVTGIFGSIVFTIILVNYNRKKYNYAINVIKNIGNNISKNNSNIDSKECSSSILQSINMHNDINNEIIDVKNIYFKYYKSNGWILNNISLKIYKNDILLLLGQNGSGKTTFLKIISGLLRPHLGDVIFKQNSKLVDLHNMDFIERSKIISYVKQNFSNLNNIIVSDYLLLGMVNELKFYEQPTQNQLNKVFEYAEKLNIIKLLDKKISEISGGEKQLVAICQALLQDTQIIILDEPTSSLDSDNEKLVIDTLMKLSMQYNKTVVFSTHNMNHKNIKGCRIFELIQN